MSFFSPRPKCLTNPLTSLGFFSFSCHFPIFSNYLLFHLDQYRNHSTSPLAQTLAPLKFILTESRNSYLSSVIYLFYLDLQNELSLFYYPVFEQFQRTFWQDWKLTLWGNKTTEERSLMKAADPVQFFFFLSFTITLKNSLKRYMSTIMAIYRLSRIGEKEFF